jgi:hypothetical protein
MDWPGIGVEFDRCGFIDWNDESVGFLGPVRIDGGLIFRAGLCG